MWIHLEGMKLLDDRRHWTTNDGGEADFYQYFVLVDGCNE